MKETKLFELVTGTEMKPWLSGNTLPNINTCENGWSNFSANLRVVSLKLLELSQFAWPNLSVPGKFPQGCSKRFLPSATWAIRCRTIINTILHCNHSRLPICLITTIPEQQMNKLCVQVPFPNGTDAMKTLANTNNLSSHDHAN